MKISIAFIPHPQKICFFSDKKTQSTVYEVKEDVKKKLYQRRKIKVFPRNQPLHQTKKLPLLRKI